jgi:hypothetical protein
LWTTVDDPEAVIDFTGNPRRRSVLFEAATGDDRARFQARAQRGYTPETLAATDFVTASTGVPVFSTRVVDRIGDALRADATFFPCAITCQGEKFEFFAARVETRTSLFDESRSVFRHLADGGRSLVKPAYRSGFDREFLLARDHHELFDLAASERFRQLATEHGLAIAFLPREQAAGA